MSEEQKNKVTVKVYGQTYKLVGDEDPDYLLLIAQYVNAKMDEIESKHPRLDTTKIAVLSALNIADEYIKLKQKYERLAREHEDQTAELIAYKKESGNEHR